MTWQRAALAFGLLLVLAVAGWATWSNERLIATGDTVYLELLPRDPRSPLQGDYMALDYEVARAAQRDFDPETWPSRGRLLLELDERRVAEYRRRLESGASVPEGHVAFTYRVTGAGLQVATDAWFFEEGQAAVYQPAEFGEFRVSDSGDHILVRMRDEDLEPLGEPLPRW